MSQDYPNRRDWLNVRLAQRDPIPTRVVWPASNGTYVRRRNDPEENARLTAFANRCNGRFRERQERRAQKKAD